MTLIRTCGRNRPTRSGFTLPEMMVAMALSIGIMVILTEAFKMALDFTRVANSQKVMILQLNGVSASLSQDMRSEHFLPDDGKPNRGVRLSDQFMHKVNVNSQNWSAPRGGFFYAYNPQPTSEGTDAEGNAMSYATNHFLHFTSIRSGATEKDQFTVNSGGTIYRSNAAEVAYFLVPMPGNPKTSSGGQPLYNLVRRYRLVAQTADDINSLLPPFTTPLTPPDGEVISVPAVNPSPYTVNTLATVAKMLPAPTSYRMSFTALTSAGRIGDDILQSNVLSFQVLADWDTNLNPGVTTTPLPVNYSGGNTNYPYDYLTRSAINPAFDTQPNTPGISSTVPQAVRIRSLQITVRVFDPNLKQARQNTMTFAK